MFAPFGARGLNSGIPDAVWNTMTLRDEDDLPRDLVAIYATGDGEQLCVRTGSADRPIVSFMPGDENDDPEEVASDFGSWLREIVQGELDDE